MTRITQLPAGLTGLNAAAILGLTPSRLYDALNGRTQRLPRGLAMLIWLWPRLSKRMQADLLAGAHHGKQEARDD